MVETARERLLYIQREMIHRETTLMSSKLNQSMQFVDSSSRSPTLPSRKCLHRTQSSNNTLQPTTHQNTKKKSQQTRQPHPPPQHTTFPTPLAEPLPTHLHAPKNKPFAPIPSIPASPTSLVFVCTRSGIAAEPARRSDSEVVGERGVGSAQMLTIAIVVLGGGGKGGRRGRRCGRRNRL